MSDHLLELTTEGNFRAKVEAILASGKAHGYPLIVHNALRTPEKQAENVKKGVSQTMRSKHLPGPDGLARAVDVIDSRYGWDCPRHVWVMIGRLCVTQGCNWGGYWNLPGDPRAALKAFLEDTLSPFDPHAWAFDGKAGPIGFDPAHLESATCRWDKAAQKWTG